jgi:tellurite resistance protein TerC
MTTLNDIMMESSAHSHTQLLTGFITLVVGILILDLFVLRKKDQAPTIRQAFLWSGFYVIVALAFCGWMWTRLGANSAMTFLTGYVVEMSLSIDNLFVFILIFSSFKIAPKYQHRVLFWGIIGALIMRGICIGAGVAALQRFEWLTFIFAVILIWAGIKTLKSGGDDEDDPSNGAIAGFVRRIIPVKDDYIGDQFFVREHNRLMATPLLLALILVEISDVIFAVDSIPAVLAVSKDTFIVYTSNIFAILGLRSLYFVLASMVNLFRHLDKAISFILIFIGIKIGVEHWYHIPVGIALSVILISLALGIGSSLLSKAEVQDASESK